MNQLIFPHAKHPYVEQELLMIRTNLTRRQSLKMGIASAMTAAWGTTGTAMGHSTQDDAPGQRHGRRPRNIIFMVSDGMSAGTLTLTDSFARIVRDDEARPHWTNLLVRPDVVRGLEETYSLDSLVTDSAAAASAWGSGRRVANGAINMMPDGTRLTPLAQLVKNNRRKVALVTTTTVTHATPAGFATVESSRQNQDAIAPQYLNRADVLLGGGRQHFLSASRDDQRNLVGEYEQAGYSYWNSREQLLAGGLPERVLGLFADSHLPYSVDREQSVELQKTVPTLAEMTRTALDLVDSSSHGFFMMVEGGRVDHAAHATDAASLLWEQLAFDDALGVALDYAQQNEDTLVVITTDHGNGNPSLCYANDANRRFERTAGVRASFGTLLSAIQTAGGETPSPALVADVIDTHCDIQITAEHAAALAQTIADGTHEHTLNEHLRSPTGALGQVLGNHTGIQFVSNHHTADYVICSAIGPGAERFAGLRPNTDDFTQIVDLFGIDYRNPPAHPGEAWRKDLPVPSTSAAASVVR